MNLNLAAVTSVLMTSLLMLCSYDLSAQDDTFEISMGYITHSVIESSALNGVRGRFALNMASGDSNTQKNAAAIALDANGAPAIGLATGIQAISFRQVGTPDLSVAVIGNHAFAHSSGMISVNQTSGVGNAQANGASLALGYEEVVAESVLSSTTSGAVPIGVVAGKGRQAVSIHDTAFHGARGLVQVNQSAGSGNSTANNFALQVQMGAKP